MNRHQLKKLLEKQEDFTNLSRYIDIIDDASFIKLNLKNLKNANIMATLFDQAVIASKPVEIPFDNILLDVRDLKINDVLLSNMTIHMYPITLKFGETDVVVSIVNIFTGIEMDYRPYLVYADASGIHVMPVFRTEDNSTCECYKENAFCRNPRFWMDIISKTPANLGDIGFCIDSCKNFTCKPTVAVPTISKAIRSILAYMTIPEFAIIKVTDPRELSGSYYVYINENQYDELLIDGNDKADLKQTSIDGADILRILEKKSILTTDHCFFIEKTQYEVVKK